jgi:hypothetical protein
VGTELLPSAVTTRLKGWVGLAGSGRDHGGEGLVGEGGGHGGLTGDDDQVAAVFGDVLPEHFLLGG